MANSKSVGLTRLDGCLYRIPVSKTAWWQGIKEGRFPQGVKLSERTTAWRNCDLDELEELLSAGKDWRDHIEVSEAA